MVIGDIPVKTGEETVVALVTGEVGLGTRIIVILAHEVICYTFHVGLGST